MTSSSNNKQNTLIPLIFAHHECAKVNNVRNRLFFSHLSARKLTVRDFLKCCFRPGFGGILKYLLSP